MDRPVLVTGASGLLGYAVAERLALLGDVLAVVHRHDLTPSAVRRLSIDLSLAGAAAGLVREYRPWWIVHCAALANVDRCEDVPEEASLLNAQLPADLARAASAAGAWMLHMSTDAVFDGEHGPYAEDAAPGPLNVYSRTKLDGERAVRAELPDRSIVVRATIYGWNVQPKRSLGEWFLDALRAGRSVIGFTDAVFTPMLVDDLADVFAEIIARPAAGVFHAGSGDRTSKYDFGVLLARHAGLDAGLVVPGRMADVPLRAVRPRDTSLTTARIAAHLGRALPSVDEGIRRFLALEASRSRRSGSAA